MYILRNFQIQELVDQKTFLKFGKQAQMFFREDALRALDELRDLLGRPLIVNNWKEDGAYEWSGLRTMDCYTGAKWSGHRFGCAFDVKCPTMVAPRVQEFIRTRHKEGYLKDIRRMELDTPTWTHIDTLSTPYTYLFEFKP